MTNLTIYSSLPVGIQKTDLSSYIRYVNSIKPLDHEEERYLLDEFCNKGKVTAGQTVVLSHLRLVVKIAFEYKNFYNSLVDLISEGNLGLLKALKKFSTEKGVRFSTYASLWIRANIQDFILKTKSVIRIGTTALQKKILYNYSKVRNDLIESGYENPTIEQIADYLEVDPSDIHNLQKASSVESINLERNDAKSLDFEDKNSNFEEQMLHSNFFQSKKIARIIDTLKPIEKQVIEARVLSNEPQTLSVLSKKFSLSQERIRQIEKTALSKLKKILKKEDFYT